MDTPSSPAADRRGLRYPSHLTDDEGAIVAPMIPLGETADANARPTCAKLERISTRSGPDARGRRCPKTAAKSTVHDYLSSGTGMALWNASTTRFTLQCASRKDVKPVRRQRSSTRRPQGVLKKGGFARSFRLRRGQEGQRSKRHILVDTLGLLFSVVVHLADVQDRDGAFHLL